MRRNIPLALALIVSVAFARAGDPPLTPTTSVRLTGAKEAAAILGTADEFTERMSPFDRQARLQRDRDVSAKDFLAFAAAAARDWQPAEERKIAEIVRELGPKVAELKLNLPKSVLVIKTTGEEEGDAAYTRANAVILPRPMLWASAADLRQIIAHELFHVLTRHDAALREALYGSIGFQPCSEIATPREFADRKITNPDAPRNDHYIRVTYAGKPMAVVPILYASADNYQTVTGGNFFRYMLSRLLIVEKVGSAWQVTRSGSLKLDEVEQFYEQVGRNTEYTIHPEEILADNFALILTGRTEGAPSPEVLARIERVLRKPPARQDAARMR